jgi:hypothetical protein
MLAEPVGSVAALRWRGGRWRISDLNLSAPERVAVEVRGWYARTLPSPALSRSGID